MLKKLKKIENEEQWKKQEKKIAVVDATKWRVSKKYLRDWLIDQSYSIWMYCIKNYFIKNDISPIEKTNDFLTKS